MKILNFGLATLKYKIVYKNNKNTYFRIKDDYVLVTTNKNVNEQKIIAFLTENRDKFIDLTTRNREIINNEKKLEISLWGNVYPLYITNSYNFSYRIDLLGVHVTTPHQELDLIKKQIYKEALIDQLKITLLPINQTLKQFKIKPRNIKIKYLRSKFGSYHKKNDEITLNSFLATLDEKYLEYVIYHEYAHVIEFNHSQKFYNLLKQLMPDYQKYHKELKKMVII